MKRWHLILLLLVCPLFLKGQTTSITATVVDSDGTTWANGSWKLSFYPNPDNPNPSAYNYNGSPLDPAVMNQKGSLDSSGNLGFSVYQNTAISPAGSMWQLTVCPNAVTLCGSYLFVAAGASMNLSSALTTAIPAPRFHPISGTYGYNDTEATLQLLPGSTYYNVTSSTPRCYSGTIWADCGGGGSGDNPNQIDINTDTLTSCGQSYRVTSGTVTITLPSAISTGCLIGLQSASASAATITSPVITYNGPTTLLNKQSILIQTDGINFNGSYGSSLPSGSLGSYQFNVSGIFGGTANTFDVSAFPGADWGAKVNACMTQLLLINTGTCDGSHFTTPQTSSTDITVGNGGYPIKLKLPPTTVTFASGKRLFYRSFSSIEGSNGMYTDTGSSSIICTDTTTSCVQSYAEGAGALYGTELKNFYIKAVGTPGVNSVGLQLSGAGYVDVLQSNFINLSVNGFNTGTFMDSVGGCICYNKFKNINSFGTTVGARTQNDSGYAFGVNSNQWTGGRLGGTIGLWDSGTNKFSWEYLDLESNSSSTGAVLFTYIDGNNAGSGYSIGDTFRPTGGNGDAVFTVSAVTGGVPTAITITTPGTGYTNTLSSTTTTLTGAGTGLHVDVRVSAYMLVLSNGGDFFLNPYEEAGGGDYLCGTGNFVLGAWGTSNGGIYSPVFCSGPSNQYVGSASDFIFGTSSTPRTMGVSSAFIWGGKQYDDGYNSSVLMQAVPNDSFSLIEMLYAKGVQSIYGKVGHSPFKVGWFSSTGGQQFSGGTLIYKLPDPSAPTVVSNVIGSTTWQYSIVCSTESISLFGNNTISLQSPTGQTTTGAATLDASHYNTISWNCGDGYDTVNVLKYSGGTWQQLYANHTPHFSTTDTGQALTTYTLPTRNTTGDVVVQQGISNIIPPTSCTGLVTGTLYNNAGTPAFCP